MVGGGGGGGGGSIHIFHVMRWGARQVKSKREEGECLWVRWKKEEEEGGGGGKGSPRRDTTVGKRKKNKHWQNEKAFSSASATDVLYRNSYSETIIAPTSATVTKTTFNFQTAMLAAEISYPAQVHVLVNPQMLLLLYVPYMPIA